MVYYTYETLSIHSTRQLEKALQTSRGRNRVNYTTQYLLTAIEAAISAGELLMQGFHQSFTIDQKPGIHNLVTEWDKRSEKLLISLIQTQYPNHAILAEESGLHDTPSQITWVIDPLDGTVNFAHGIPVFCVSIAVCHLGEPICAAIYQPITHELFTAQKGLGARLNGTLIHSSSVSDLQSALLATGFPYNVQENPLQCIEKLSSVLHLGLPIRRLGSAALDLCYTAAGRYDGYFESSLEPWDIAAGKLILQESGGKLTDFFGNDRPTLSKNSVLATNGIIHEQMLHLLRQTP